MENLYVGHISVYNNFTCYTFQGKKGPAGYKGIKGAKVIATFQRECTQDDILLLQGHPGEKGAEGAVGMAGEPVSLKHGNL